MIVRSKAPLRLGLAGGGTDISSYSDVYGGQVLNVTINMYVYCTIEPSDNGCAEFIATDRGESLRLESALHFPTGGVLPLHTGTYNAIVKRFKLNSPLSFKMTTYSDAPAGSGLGSSSTLVVAMLKAYMEWLNLPFGEYDMASFAYQIEREDLGLSGGKQDQYAATFGGFNFIEFRRDGDVIVNPLRIKNWIRNELENSLVLYNTGTSRDSAKIIDEQIASTKKADGMEGMHKLKESAVVMKNAVLRGDFGAVSESLRQGWDAKKRTSSVISNDTINSTYSYILEHGGLAAKLSGAGGGGFMMIICDPVKRHTLTAALERLGGRVFLPDFTDKGTQAWTLYEP